LRFTAPVRIGDTVTATCTIQEINAERRRVTMNTVCTVGDTVVVEGSATFLVSRRTKKG
jgi:3-hydroxybutyryl-CoA dehydratase